MRYTAFLAMVVAWASTAGAQSFWIGPNHHVLTPGLGGRVWGDCKDHNAGAHSYYVPPRRAADLSVTGADFTVWADNVGQASIGADLVPVSTYGYGVDDSAPVVAEVNDIALLAAGDRESLSDSAGFNGSTNAVPEPSTVVLGGLALAGLVAAGRRRAGK